MVAALGVLGFVNSFRAVSRAAAASFGGLAPTVPLGIDLAIAVFSAMDLVLARLDMRPRWVRLVPWALTGATIYLNVAGQDTWFGRIAHAVFPALWVLAVSLAAHVIRIRAQLAAGTGMDRIRPSRWLLAPVSTARLWRRMVLWEIRSYPDALDRERGRLLALTDLQDAYGVIAWRWNAPRRVRALYRLGELAPAGLVQDDLRADGARDTSAALRAEIETARAALRTELGACIEAARDALSAEISAALAGSGGGEAAPMDRDALVAELADQIRDAITSGDRWAPDYDALMERTGFRRRWCEKAVQDARTLAFRVPHSTRTDEGSGADTARTVPGAAAGEDPHEDADRADELALAGAT
jgi:hypothetical protein